MPALAATLFVGDILCLGRVEARPCTLPARPIETRHPGLGARFKAAVRDNRGVTAWVEAEGVMRRGDTLRSFVPD